MVLVDAEPPFSPNPLRPPVRPLFIAALCIFKSYWVVLFAQILIGSVIPLLGMRIVNKVIPSSKISIIVGFRLRWNHTPFFFVHSLYNETFFIFLYFLTVLSLMYLKTVRTEILFGRRFFGARHPTKPTVQYPPVAIPFYVYGISVKSSPRK